MSLPTPITIRALQRKLYLMAKRSHEHRVEALGNAVTLATSRDQRFRDPYECAQWRLHALRKNLIREPDAGNPHVRFDERGRETGSCDGLRHRLPAKAAGQRLLPIAPATAPVPDSTELSSLISTGSS